MTPMTSPESAARFRHSPRRQYYRGGNLDRVRAVEDLRARAHKLMPRLVLEYLEAGAGSEATLDREREAFAEWRFLPHTLVDESHRSTERELLGRTAAMPLAIAPTGLNGLFRYHADTMLAKGAARFGVPFIQSTMSNDPMEEVGKVPGLRHWWQLYVFGGEEIWQELLRRADAAGCEALVLTTNSQIFGDREWSDRTRTATGGPTLASIFDAARHPRWMVAALRHGLPRFANVLDFIPKDQRGFFESAHWIRSQMPRDLSWNDVARIRSRWKKPMFLKGLLNLEDVRRARDSGVDGIMLGSHGGRQMDWAASALDILAPAREIVGESVALYMSGGIRHGTDILKALLLGADAVLSGRATLYGLCAAGADGVTCALETLRRQMLNEMGQLGVSSLDALSAEVMVRREKLPVALAS
ncbi:alpha-hydroxy acid oxidase [Stakelama tenebrarum]|uniref:Alpha-hydroxy-acid oxidizing protein n=1 Tax=Stakelama tenebrarum TaxID=2711215 RepID=A0A6G6Y5M2_9SPHN|nr:alpha-hydroxy acid oxidase [Sphingosinithalassobacter tenebrarum]QIG80232.1 alpha-hydroxy-acid oxidizing protein [Sphingosinithalassobacter tenebrarum]